jgi:hypothetical protein
MIITGITPPPTPQHFHYYILELLRGITTGFVNLMPILLLSFLAVTGEFESIIKSNSESYSSD